MGDSFVDTVDAAHPHWLTFLGQWLKHPRRMASVVPSGRQLAQLMVAALPHDCHEVIELGAGTGAITDALLHHGISPQALLAVEMNPVFHQLLQRRFPQTHIACGDACQLKSLAESSCVFGPDGVDAVCSSLGLLTMPKSLQHDIMAAAFSMLRPAGIFVQYTYGRHHPLDDEVRERLGLHCRRFGLAWRNLPPARVYVYSRQAAA
jgi:phosphatidylethanolamine/phosphatidyl-N-methylethanolamine N-methyltransferase